MTSVIMQKYHSQGPHSTCALNGTVRVGNDVKTIYLVLTPEKTRSATLGGPRLSRK